MTIEGKGLRIGVWEENGVIYRRDSEKETFARTYQPIDLSEIEEVKSLVLSLHSGAKMNAWTAQVEAQQDLTLKALQELII